MKRLNDYCTGFNSNRHNHCCYLHDKAYSRVGTIGRKEADRQLRECWISNGMPKKLAWAGYFIVRAVGWLFWKKRDDVHDAQ